MSLGQQIFGRVYSAVGRKIRGGEGLAGTIWQNSLLLRRFVFYLGSAFCAGRVFQYWVLEHGSSEGPSMYPTMGERTPFTLTSKLHYYGRNISPGDIVEFTSPIFRHQRAGKRIIGIQNDYIVLDPHGSASVGGAAVPGVTDWRSQTEIESGLELKDREEPMMIEVPQGHVYVVGDNMSWSRDSRFYGPLPMALVRGKQILHTNSIVPSSGWQWTYGEQLTRIPKEEEEKYLNRWRQRQAGDQNTTVQKLSETVAKGTD